MGACGLFDYERNNDNVAALNQFDYGFPTWKGPNCGRCISVYFPDIKMSKVFRVTDRCEQTGSNCYRGDVDLHFTAFPDALRRHGKVKIQWKYLSSCAQRVDSGIGFGNIKSGSSAPKPKPKPKPKRKPAPKRKSKSKGRNRQ
ncbi:hypothetical protein BKA69DRAFT_759096 [Paraphysoderma sedebokerense]|nr:hypothetical protein BKA69DRAFT_759096 [Paraphysoderma sedebokerense]